MEKRLLWKHTDTNRRSPALAAWFCLPLFLFLLLVCASALPTTAEAAETVYVSSSGNDESGDGTKGKPYATLAKAVTEAEDNATIYVMSDLTMNQSARFWNKNLTITSAEGEPYTIKRGENFAATNDPARNGYNGALIEVGGTDTDTIGSLTLTNITLDDNGLAPKDVDEKAITYKRPLMEMETQNLAQKSLIILQLCRMLLLLLITEKAISFLVKEQH